MVLEPLGYIELPPHVGSGGFDHAAVHRRTGRVYVAHTANDAIDVIDGSTNRYTGSIGNLTAVAGALVSDDDDLVFSSNRGESAVGIFSVSDQPKVVKVPVGVRPNGLAYDPVRRRLLAANVGEAGRRDSFTVSIVDVATGTRLGDIAVAGRTRWTVFDPVARVFHVNIADPPEIAVVDADGTPRVRRTVRIPGAGPHGLDLDVAARRLFCACDGGQLVEVEADSGEILRSVDIGGVPDVVFFNAALRHLYVAIGDPGMIEVFETDSLRRRGTVPTEQGAHTLALAAGSSTVYAFLPASHRAAVYLDRG
jgi:DNA-binding beta-propeller fold protein YncE